MTGCEKGSGKLEKDMISVRHFAGLVSSAYAGLRKRDSTGNDKPLVVLPKCFGESDKHLFQVSIAETWIAVDILGGNGGTKTWVLRLSQPKGAVTMTPSNVPWYPPATSISTIPVGVLSALVTSEFSLTVALFSTAENMLARMSRYVKATRSLSGLKLASSADRCLTGTRHAAYLPPSRHPATCS